MLSRRLSLVFGVVLHSMLVYAAPAYAQVSPTPALGPTGGQTSPSTTDPSSTPPVTDLGQLAEILKSSDARLSALEKSQADTLAEVSAIKENSDQIAAAITKGIAQLSSVVDLLSVKNQGGKTIVLTDVTHNSYTLQSLCSSIISGYQGTPVTIAAVDFVAPSSGKLDPATGNSTPATKGVAKAVICYLKNE